MDLNELSYQIRKAAFKVHKILGPGLLEIVYEKALVYELTKMGIYAERQVGVPTTYETLEFDTGFMADVIVENRIIVEVKSVEYIIPRFRQILLTYLKLSNKKLGFIFNFNCERLVDKVSIIRMVNGL